MKRNAKYNQNIVSSISTIKYGQKKYQITYFKMHGMECTSWLSIVILTILMQININQKQ